MNITNILMKLANAKCPSCQQALRIDNPEEVLRKREIVCSNCGHSIKPPDLSARAPAVDKTQATPTKQVKVSQQAGGLRLDIRWLSQSSKFIIGFAFMWNTLIGIFVLGMIHGKKSDGALMGYAIIGLLGLAGLWLAYSAVCELLNTTTILVKNNQIVFWTEPLSTKGRQTFPISGIANLGLERSEGGEQNGRRIYKHFVNLHLKNGDIVQLTRVQNMNEGIYVERLLEERLGLQDNSQFDRIAY